MARTTIISDVLVNRALGDVHVRIAEITQLLRKVAG